LSGKYISATTSKPVASTFQDVYTAPAGRRAAVLGFSGFNTTGVSVNYQAALKTGGSYYMVAASSTTSNNQPASNVVNIVLEPGESIAILEGTNAGMDLRVNVIEFDANVAFYSPKVLNPGLGTTTVYTVPAGKTAALTNIVSFSIFATGIMATWNASGSATVRINYKVPPDQIATVGLNQMSITNGGANAATFNGFGVPNNGTGDFLNAGDKIQFADTTTDLTGTGSITWINVVER